VQTRLLAIYLNDHLAGATGGLELARRACGANRGTAFEAPLEQLAAEIAADRRALLDVMRRLGVGRDRVKERAGWVAEKLGRLKLNGRLRGYSPLSRVVELEAISLGVEGKRALWRTLAHAGAGDARLDGVDLDALSRRAEDQRRLVEGERVRAVEIAFARPERPGSGEPRHAARTPV
jgi:hypothetical protein